MTITLAGPLNGTVVDLDADPVMAAGIARRLIREARIELADRNVATAGDLLADAYLAAAAIGPADSPIRRNVMAELNALANGRAAEPATP